jgi:hypothetical protein
MWKDGVTEGWRKLDDEDLNNLYSTRFYLDGEIKEDEMGAG